MTSSSPLHGALPHGAAYVISAVLGWKRTLLGFDGKMIVASAALDCRTGATLSPKTLLMERPDPVSTERFHSPSPLHYRYFLRQMLHQIRTPIHSIGMGPIVLTGLNHL